MKTRIEIEIQEYSDDAVEEEERDALARELQEERYHRQAVERSEQALAAYVERLKPIADYGLRSARNRNNPQSLEWTNTLADAPETSLSRRDARMKAEALEEAVTLYGHEWNEEFAEVVTDIMRKGHGFIYPEGLLEFAAEYRRQAEGVVNES